MQGTIWNLPIFDYSKGKYAYGDNVDTTVNPYKLFDDGSPRRMFKHNDVFTRTYHIKPPDMPGPFEFGYVVSACWAPPTKTPVTNPLIDFPIIANCEDAYGLSVEQLTTINQETFDNMDPIFKVTVKHRQDKLPPNIGIYSSTCISVLPPHVLWENAWVFVSNEDEQYPVGPETAEVIVRANSDHAGNDEIIPGWHFGILVSTSYTPGDPIPPPPEPGEQFLHPITVYPLMFYVEG